MVDSIGRAGISGKGQGVCYTMEKRVMYFGNYLILQGATGCIFVLGNA